MKSLIVALAVVTVIGLGQLPSVAQYSPPNSEALSMQTDQAALAPEEQVPVTTLTPTPSASIEGVVANVDLTFCRDTYESCSALIEVRPSMANVTTPAKKESGPSITKANSIVIFASPDTQVTWRGAAVRLMLLQPGDEVKIDYVASHGVNAATSVDLIARLGRQ